MALQTVYTRKSGLFYMSDKEQALKRVTGRHLTVIPARKVGLASSELLISYPWTADKLAKAEQDKLKLASK
jgi:hypothetical protein